ncbi:MAG: hypothetical protein UV82_C0007G0062 [Candidatus Magasanikbacteria bacterium GW2011_GWD2_43_18]|nr:MAG: hypothetical protein UV82_C0007G0062 [Candidatus Magasanikbacteria bacterium GW2011_GWD2_43_18]
MSKKIIYSHLERSKDIQHHETMPKIQKEILRQVLPKDIVLKLVFDMSNIKLTTGIFSFHDNTLPHFGHADLPFMTDFPTFVRQIQAFRKLPKSTPRIVKNRILIWGHCIIFLYA